MRRKLNKKNDAGKRSTKKRWMILLFIFISLSIGTGALIMHYKRKPEPARGVSVYFAALMNWMAERKHQLQPAVAKIKQLTDNEETPPEEIHFEFYTALPNMQMPVVKSQQEAVPPAKPQNQLSANSKIFSSEELEQDFSQQLDQSKERTKND